MPIYDARTYTRPFSAILKNLKDIERYDGEIPEGSATVVGYTVNPWKASNGQEELNISFNIQFAILLSLSK